MANYPRVGVGVIVTKDDRLLLLERKGVHGQGTWSTPGGHLEYGESPEACAARETKEETGVEIVNVRVRATGHLPCPPLTPAALSQPDPSAALLDRRRVVLAHEITEIPFYDGQALKPGHQFPGPAVVIHPDTTIFIEPGDEIAMDAYKNLLITLTTPNTGDDLA